MKPEEISYKIGNLYPYDDPEKGGQDGWTVRAARGIVADLQDRAGIKDSFEGVDPDLRIEIIKRMAEIIQLAFDEWAKNLSTPLPYRLKCPEKACVPHARTHTRTPARQI